MATKVRAVDYFALDMPNKPGEGEQVLALLRKAGVDLEALSAFPRGRRTQVDVIPRDSQALKSAARTAGLALRPRKTAFLIQGDDREGAIAKLIAPLAEKGINIIAVTAVAAAPGRYGALLWVAPADVARTKRLLKAK